MNSSNTKKKWVSSRIASKKDTDTSKITNTNIDTSKITNTNIDTSTRTNTSTNKYYKTKNTFNKTPYKNKGLKQVIKISNLPDNITVQELNNLISEWGNIGNINIKKYTYSGTSNISAYIDFYNIDEANYFVKALDNTPFDYMIIEVKLMDFSTK